MSKMKIEISPGTHIEGAAKEALTQAAASGSPVTFDFNGVEVTAHPGDEWETIVDRWNAAIGNPAGPAKPFHPFSCADALARWDAGETVFTIEMGGLGPGYEQAIQVLVFEIIRDYLLKPLPEGKTFGDWGDDTVHRIDAKMGGYSGAMVGAAKQVAYHALRDGWSKMLESVPEDRKIQVSKHVPNL